MAKKDQQEEQNIDEKQEDLGNEGETDSQEVGDAPQKEEVIAEKSLEEKCQEYENGWKRALADYENLRRDMQTRNEEARRAIKAKLAQDLLPVIDNFAQVIKFQPDFSDLPEEAKKKIDPWLQGITYIDRQFSEALSQMGVEAIDTSGQFDPNLHEASGEKTDADREDGDILEVLIPGWKIGEIVLRPAKVIVNKKEE